MNLCIRHIAGEGNGPDRAIIAIADFACLDGHVAVIFTERGAVYAGHLFLRLMELDLIVEERFSLCQLKAGTNAPYPSSVVTFELNNALAVLHATQSEFSVG